MVASDLSRELTAFEEGRLDPGRFRHRDHVRVSYELLERYPFPEALLRLAAGLRNLATKSGRPEVYHETITAAFLALIGERRLGDCYSGWKDFAARNPDLLRKELLEDWYEPVVLQSSVARQTFILPGKVTRAPSHLINTNVIPRAAKDL